MLCCFCVIRSKGWWSLEETSNQTHLNLKRWSACYWTMMSWRRNVSVWRHDLNPCTFSRSNHEYEGTFLFFKNHCVFSCSASETGGEEAARGEQQGEGAQEKKGEVRWEGMISRKIHIHTRFHRVIFFWAEVLDWMWNITLERNRSVLNTVHLPSSLPGFCV